MSTALRTEGIGARQGGVPALEIADAGFFLSHGSIGLARPAEALRHDRRLLVAGHPEDTVT